MKSSLVNVSDLSEFVACIIPYNVSSSGELTRTSFILFHDGLAFSGVARERLVLFIGAPLTAIFTIQNKLQRLRILRPRGWHTRSEYTSGSSNKLNLTCLQTSASTIPNESLRCAGLNRFCDDEFNCLLLTFSR